MYSIKEYLGDDHSSYKMMNKILCSYLYKILYVASYDGTDIARPYLVDNSTGTPVYTYLDDENYHLPSNLSKRGATSRSYQLWPKGIVYYEFDSSLTG